jgi:hypothetical protein
MVLLGWMWLGTPFAVIALISHDERLRMLVNVYCTPCRAAGWTGAAMMCLGAVIMPEVLGTMMFIFGTPLSGLAVWLRNDGGDDGGESSDVPPFDWDAFERSFWAHVRRQRLQPHRPREPSVR